jgi:hypothetical protein
VFPTKRRCYAVVEKDSDINIWAAPIFVFPACFRIERPENGLSELLVAKSAIECRYLLQAAENIAFSRLVRRDLQVTNFAPVVDGLEGLARNRCNFRLHKLTKQLRYLHQSQVL